MPLIQDENEVVRDFAYTGHHDQAWSIQNEEWRFILPLTDDADELHPDEKQLYNREVDPYDQKNVISDNTEVADSLELNLRRWVTSLR